MALVRYIAGCRFRVLTGLAAACVLVLQISMPPMVHASNAAAGWIEICTEAGLVQVQVDQNGDLASGEAESPAHAPCLKCTDCFTCASVSEATLFNTVLLGKSALNESRLIWQAELQNVPSHSSVWRMTRGPPVEPILQSARAGRAFIVTPNSKGGAL